VDWVKEIDPRGGASEGWRDDFPLDHELPDALVIDCSRLEMPLHPMFAVRLRVFVDWHRREGRAVGVVPPAEGEARRVFRAMGIDPELDGDPEADTIVPVTRLEEYREVEETAERTQEVLEYQLHDVSPLGQATFMAVSELCNNAIDHGRNNLGAYLAVRRISEPRRQVSIAISDLGIGIPEHIRQRYPEWGDDGWAIAHATQEGVSGTGDPHRGIGFSAVMEAALTNSLHSARMDILSANGFCRLQSVQETPKVEVFPAARFRRGTWIAYDLVSV
jgi:anti-sigma regulatory factor (Ser/Thr protein kinase)